MNNSPEIAQLAASLVKAQAEMPNVPLDKMVQYKGVSFAYASLSNCIALTKPVLAKHGLAIVQYPVMGQASLSVATRIIHASGEWIEAELSMPIESNDPKLVGSLLSYLRRYCYTAMLGIAHEDDNDAQTIQALYEGTEEHKRWLKEILEPLGVGKEGMRSIHDYMLKHKFEMTQDSAIIAMEKIR